MGVGGGAGAGGGGGGGRLKGQKFLGVVSEACTSSTTTFESFEVQEPDQYCRGIDEVASGYPSTTPRHHGKVKR